MTNFDQQVSQHSQLLLSKSLDHNPGRKRRSKNKKDCPWKIVKYVDEYMYGLGSVLYWSPHQIMERNQLRRIQGKNSEVFDQAVFLKTDYNFLKICKTGQYQLYDFKANSQGEKQLSQKNQSEQTSHSIKNAIPIYNQAKPRKISKQMPVCSLENQELSIRGDFQCANVHKFVKISKKQYMIILSNDTNTEGYTQWFNFFIQSNYEGQEMIKFIIVNIRKPMKYLEGMRLLTKSRNHEKWSRNLQFIQFQSGIRAESKKYSAIAFCLSSTDLQEGLFVCPSLPYPFSRVRNLCQQIISSDNDLKIIEIGKSFLGNSIYVFKQEAYPKLIKKKIIILARQHASQTSSSYICEFLIKKLAFFNCYDNLKRQFNWYIIPIANPDGVIHGNSRTNQKGFDMNRCWAPYMLSCSPEVQCINNYLQSLGLNSDDVFIDLHTHSRDFGFFTFASFQNDFVKLINSKMKQVCKFFDQQKCKIGYDVKKRNTFRVQMQNRFRIKNAITIQTSFYGHISRQNQQLKPFQVYDYQEMAISLLQCLDSYSRNQIVTDNSNGLHKKIAEIDYSNSSSDPDDDDDLIKQENFKISVVQQVNLSPLPKKSISNNSIILNQRKAYQKDKRAENRTNIVNLFSGVKSFEAKRSGPSKSFRIMSACMNGPINEIESKQVFNKRNQNLSGLKKIDQEGQVRNYLDRKSFKSLFIHAQLRNQDEKYKQLSKSQSRHKLKFMSENNEDRKDPSKKIKNVIFPTSNQNDIKIIKQLEQNLQRKTIFKTGKGFNLDRKMKLSKPEKQVDKANDKIAKLCEYVRNLEKTELFF